MIALEATGRGNYFAIGVFRRGRRTGSLEEDVARVTASAVSIAHVVRFTVGVDWHTFLKLEIKSV